MGEIVFKNVTKSFGTVKAVDNVNFLLRDGEFLTLLGPSGCGKSTTLNLIAGMLSPTEGEIYINGKLMNEIPCNKRNIGFVFQSYALFPHMTVFENVAFGLKMKKYPKSSLPDKVKEALRLVNMLGYEERKPSELSGGQQQRIALARALVFDPDVLLLDEPLSNLDAKLRESVGFEIKQLHEKTKKTIIYVTHDQIEALTMSDRIILMNKGTIEQSGVPFALYSSPKTLFVADFIGANSFIECVVEKVEETFVDVSFTGNHVRAHKAPDLSLLPGETGTLAIRPESIHIINSEHATEFTNTMTGVIANLTFRGADVLLYIDISGTIVKAELSSARSSLKEFTLGEPISIGFDECVVFEKSN